MKGVSARTPAPEGWLILKELLARPRQRADARLRPAGAGSLWKTCRSTDVRSEVGGRHKACPAK